MSIPSWSSGSLGSFLYSSSVYSCYLFLISSDSVGSLPFLFFIVSILSRNIPLISPFFLKSSLVFLNLLFSPISLHYYLKKSFFSLLAILWNSAFKSVHLSFPLCLLHLFFSQLFVSPPQTTFFLFLISFSWRWP